MVSRSCSTVYSTVKEGYDYAQSATLLESPRDARTTFDDNVTGERMMRYGNSLSVISIKQEKVITWIVCSMRFEYFKLFMKTDYGDFLKETKIKS